MNQSMWSKLWSFCCCQFQIHPKSFSWNINYWEGEWFNQDSCCWQIVMDSCVDKVETVCIWTQSQVQIPQSLIINKNMWILDAHCFLHDRTWTCNPQIQNLVPYQLGHMQNEQAIVTCLVDFAIELWSLILFFCNLICL